MTAVVELGCDDFRRHRDHEHAHLGHDLFPHPGAGKIDRDVGAGERVPVLTVGSRPPLGHQVLGVLAGAGHDRRGLHPRLLERRGAGRHELLGFLPRLLARREFGSDGFGPGLHERPQERDDVAHEQPGENAERHPFEGEGESEVRRGENHVGAVTRPVPGRQRRRARPR